MKANTLLAAAFFMVTSQMPSANAADYISVFDKGRYNPAVSYGGPYSANAVYYHNPGNPKWRIGFKRELDYVTCAPALNSLRLSGIWKGHLRQDGSCGDMAEPVDFAVGNWLNFEAAKGR